MQKEDKTITELCAAIRCELIKGILKIPDGDIWAAVRSVNKEMGKYINGDYEKRNDKNNRSRK